MSESGRSRGCTIIILEIHRQNPTTNGFMMVLLFRD
jgi:hypothetical protein